MEIQTTKTESLSWDYPQFGRFTATITDNQLSGVELFRITGQHNGALVTDDLEYVRAVYHALGELLRHLDKHHPPRLHIYTEPCPEPYPAQVTENSILDD